MWSNDDSISGGYNAGGGGFLDTSNKFDSPSTGKKQGGARRAQSVTPVVIGMLKNCPNDEFTMWGNPTSILKLVCIVRKFEVTSTTVTYELEDHTGRIKAVLWLEHDAAAAPNIPVDKENIYVKVFGTFRTKGSEKLIMILKIAPLDKLNELTCHLLEVIYVRTMTEKKSMGEQTAIRANNPGAELTNSMMNYASGFSMDEEGMTPIQQKVYRFIRNTTSDIGAARSSIMENFPANQHRDVNNAIAFLVSEGHIFSSVDQDHFKSTTQ